MEESIYKLLKTGKGDIIADAVWDLMKDRRHISDIDKLEFPSAFYNYSSSVTFSNLYLGFHLSVFLTYDRGSLMPNAL